MFTFGIEVLYHLRFSFELKLQQNICSNLKPFIIWLILSSNTGILYKSKGQYSEETRGYYLKNDLEKRSNPSQQYYIVVVCLMRKANINKCS